MEKLRFAPFFIPTAKYVVCASTTHIAYSAQSKTQRLAANVPYIIERFAFFFFFFILNCFTNSYY